MLTLTEAAKSVGKSKSTLVRAIKNGKLSAQRNEHGEYRVVPSELYRVYPQIVNRDESGSESAGTTANGGVLATELLQIVKGKDAELADVRAELEDTRQRLEEHREAARLLIDPQTFEAKQEQWQAETEQARQDARIAQEKIQALKSRGFFARLLNTEPDIQR